MTIIPPNLTRVPSFYGSALALSNIGRNNLALLRVQEQMSTGRAITRVSDDIVKSAAIGVLDDRLERSLQQQRNLQHASSALNIVDDTLGEASDLANEARTIASEQVSLTSSAAERASQAVVIDQMLTSLMNVSNRQSVAGYVLGGTVTSRAPVEGFLGYYRYRGENNAGLTTDLDQASTVPITLGPTAVTGLSSRVRSNVDLDPQLTVGARLTDLRGARGVGITLGTIEMSINSGARIPINLQGSDTVQDVLDRVNAAVRQYETDNSTTVLGPGGLGVSGGAIAMDVAGSNSIQFFDVGNGIASQDLGLSTVPAAPFTSASPSGQDLGAKLTMRTPVSALAGITGPLGTIRITNAGHTQVVDLSAAQTIEDVKTVIEGANLGVRVLINDSGTGIDVLNEVSAGSRNALSISEVAGGDTATRLGIRSMMSDTRISEFNFGRGVSIIDGVRDPVSGVVSAPLNTDMTITLGDAAGTPITIDFTPDDMVSVQTVLNALNTQIQAQLTTAGLPTTTLTASLASDGNGIMLTQDPGLPNRVQVAPQNNSQAAAELGLLGGTWDATAHALTGTDNSRVRVDSLFSHLVDLRDSLTTNDISGIGFAGADIEAATNSVVETRGMVGGFAQRVQGAITRETDRSVLDESTRSQLRDVDFTQAATQFSMLQTQLQASLRTTAMTQQLSVLDYL
ncbi:MAG: flagellin [Phycisphaerales bacterium]